MIGTGTRAGRLGLLGSLLAAGGCSGGDAAAGPVQAGPALELAFNSLAAGTSGEIVDADLTRDRRLLLLDAQGHEVLVVSPGGQIVERCGRYGAGPGEMVGPVDVEAGPGGAVAVLDASLRRLVVWDQGCRLRGSLVFPGEPMWIGWASDGVLAVKTVWKQSVVSIVSVDPRRLVVRDTLAVVDAPPFDEPGQVTCRLCPIARSGRGVVAVAPPDTVYAIHALRGRSITRARWQRADLAAVPIGPAERHRLALRRDSLIAGLRARGLVPPPLDIPSYKWRVVDRGLRFDDRGDLWVETYAEGPDRGSVDVFSPSGELRGHLTLGSFGDLVSVRGDRLVALARDAEGGAVVNVLLVDSR